MKPDASPIHNHRLVPKILLFSLLTLLLFLVAQQDYLVFHSFAELFSVVIACGIFMIAWNSRRFFDNNYLLFIGIAYLFVAFFDTLHTLAYRGMGVFTSFDDNNLPPQLWLVARYLESLALLTAPLFFHRRLQVGRLFALFFLISAVAIWSIFIARVFPTCFVTGEGLTLFKRTSEYIIDLVLVAALVLLHREKDRFEPAVLRLLTLSIICTITTELFFTIYIHLYGVSNFIGHVFKILSFWFMYKAIIETALNQPYSLLFRELKQSEEALRQKEESLLLAQRLAHMGSWEWNLVDDSMWWSDEMYAIFDYEKGRVTPCLPLIISRLHAEDVATVQSVIAAYRQGNQSFKLQHRIVRTDGSTRFVKAECNLARKDKDGMTPIAVGIVHDETDQVLARKMSEEIEQITRHDLKTPLNPIMMISDLLLMDSNLTPHQTELIQLIKTSGYRMLNIIDSSLSLYKLEHGTYKLTAKSFDLLPLIAEICRECDQDLGKRDLRLICLVNGTPAGAGDVFPVTGEEMLCYTMFSNLIKNAIEASPSGEAVTVTCQQGDGWQTISIHNRGTVPEEIRDSFFDRYVTSGKKSGTGLGTYSALLAARVHQGDITMATSEEMGTLLTVRLPVQSTNGD